MTRVLLAGVLLATLTAPALAENSNPWGFMIRGGYSTPLQTGPGQSGTSDSGFFTLASRYQLSYSVALFASMGYMHFNLRRDPLVCTGPGCPDHLRTNQYLVPAGFGLRLAMGGQGEVGMPISRWPLSSPWAAGRANSSSAIPL